MPKITLKKSGPYRPHIPGYGISEDDEGMVSWDDVNCWMEESKNYWISTTGLDSNPHARPIWGIWFEDLFYFGGGQNTRNIANLRKNPNIVIHTESAEKVVIINGKAEEFDDKELHKILGGKYEERYEYFHPPPFWRVVPQVVYSWNMSNFETSPTKFICKRST
jgi:nitroimidazol reductase NimA-like FMN-containing flavoprotein (pyridoxamine 5'-phosphate oxidase superfamily)